MKGQELLGFNVPHRSSLGRGEDGDRKFSTQTPLPFLDTEGKQNIIAFGASVCGTEPSLEEHCFQGG